MLRQGRVLPAVPERLDGAQRMDVEALRRLVERDRRDGRLPFCVVANAGTTNTGAIDLLDEVADLCARERLWLHVDGAYGAAFQLTERGRRRLRGIERADSITLDPHKGFFLPFGTGCLLVRDAATLRAAHSGDDAHYLQDIGAADLPDFADYGPELTREFRGIRLWLPLHLHGVAAFRAALDEKLDLAQWVYTALADEPALHVYGVPALTTVTFRCAADDTTAELLRRVKRRAQGPPVEHADRRPLRRAGHDPEPPHGPRPRRGGGGRDPPPRERPHVGSRRTRWRPQAQDS